MTPNITPENPAAHTAPPEFDEWRKEAIKLAMNLAHVYAFVGDDSMPIAKAALEKHLDRHPAAPKAQEVERDASGVPPGEWGGLTSKQAWWAGYRVGKGLHPDMPRTEAVNASPGWQEVRLLTDEEVRSVLVTHESRDEAEGIQRRFCEVNGIPIPATRPEPK